MSTLTAAPGAPAVFGPDEPLRCIPEGPFARILHELGVTLLATTYQSGRLIAFRAPHPEYLNTHLRRFRRPMGLAVADGRLALGTQSEVWDFRDHPGVAPALEPAGVHDACYLPRNVHVTGDIMIHELAFAAGELWGVNTRFSTLCTFDADHSFVPRWRPRFLEGTEGVDQCHLNGVAVDDGRVRYATAFGRTAETGGWRADRNAGGILLEVESGEVALAGLSLPHSPRVAAGRVWLLESGKGTLAAAEPASGRLETVAELPGFTRGLAFAGPYAFVGLSRVRESGLFPGMPLAERVAERECGIWIVDLRSGEVAALLRFENVVTEIFDVQFLHGTRYPEISNLEMGILSAAYALPPSAAPTPYARAA